jgi:cell wall-associated NlpC family hydrolase
MRDDAGGYGAAAVRGFPGWSLPERSSADMASAGVRIPYRDTRPGDLLFFDGTRDGVVDHVSIALGRGWALDASDSYGGVAIIRVGEGWYRERFTHARRIT